MATAATIDRRLGHRAAARRHAEAAEAAAWLDAHAGELAGIAHEPAEFDEVIAASFEVIDEGRLHAEALAEAASLARAAAEQGIADLLDDPDLPGWGTTFDPADLQWGFTVSTRPGGSNGRITGGR